MAKIETNKVFGHLKRSTKKIVVEQGGTRSGKTYNILLWIIFHYTDKNEGKTITICRKTFPALRASVMRDFFEILRNHDIYNEIYHNRSNSEYYLNGNLVEFISLDQPQKIRGRKRNLLYINEEWARYPGKEIEAIIASTPAYIQERIPAYSIWNYDNIPFPAVAEFGPNMMSKEHC